MYLRRVFFLLSLSYFLLGGLLSAETTEPRAQYTTQSPSLEDLYRAIPDITMEDALVYFRTKQAMVLGVLNKRNCLQHLIVLQVQPDKKASEVRRPASPEALQDEACKLVELLGGQPHSLTPFGKREEAGVFITYSSARAMDASRENILALPLSSALQRITDLHGPAPIAWANRRLVWNFTYRGTKRGTMAICLNDKKLKMLEFRFEGRPSSLAQYNTMLLETLGTQLVALAFSREYENSLKKNFKVANLIATDTSYENFLARADNRLTLFASREKYILRGQQSSRERIESEALYLPTATNDLNKLLAEQQAKGKPKDETSVADATDEADEVDPASSTEPPAPAPAPVQAEKPLSPAEALEAWLQALQGL